MTSAEIIVALRKETGASFNLCKEAAEKYPDNKEKAIEYLTELLRSTVGKRGEKETKNGIVEVYSHPPMKTMACMVEVLCETDFVAKNEELQKFAHEIALQVVAMNPVYVDRSSIPEEDLTKLKAQWETDPALTGKPENIIQKILEGKLEKYCSEVCLLDQPYFKDDTIKIERLLKEITGKLGENIKIGRFIRWQI